MFLKVPRHHHRHLADRQQDLLTIWISSRRAHRGRQPPQETHVLGIDETMWLDALPDSELGRDLKLGRPDQLFAVVTRHFAVITRHAREGKCEVILRSRA
jgi:hypothetical protein